MNELNSLLAQIRACRICVEEPASRQLGHEPNPVVVASETARILIAGQAPGTRVHSSGKPFDDPSGDRLRQWLGVNREQFYDPDLFAIVPMGFCFPGLNEKGSDLPPRRECAPVWRSRLLDLMPQIELVLVIGKYAQMWHLGKSCRASMTETVRHWETFLEAPGDGPSVLPLPHPSWRNSGWLKRNLWFSEQLVPVLRREVQRLIRET